MDGALASPAEIAVRLLVLIGVAVAVAVVLRRRRRGDRDAQRPRHGGDLRDNLERMREDAPFRDDDPDGR